MNGFSSFISLNCKRASPGLKLEKLWKNAILLNSCANYSSSRGLCTCQMQTILPNLQVVETIRWSNVDESLSPHGWHGVQSPFRPLFPAMTCGNKKGHLIVPRKRISGRHTQFPLDRIPHPKGSQSDCASKSMNKGFSKHKFWARLNRSCETQTYIGHLPVPLVLISSQYWEHPNTWKQKRLFSWTDNQTGGGSTTTVSRPTVMEKWTITRVIGCKRGNSPNCRQLANQLIQVHGIKEDRSCLSDWQQSPQQGCDQKDKCVWCTHPKAEPQHLLRKGASEVSL